MSVSLSTFPIDKITLWNIFKKSTAYSKYRQYYGQNSLGIYLLKKKKHYSTQADTYTGPNIQ